MSGIRASDPIGRPPRGRKLIAVVHADMVGYSRLIGLDDVGTLERLAALRSTLIDPAIEEHGGRLVNTGGDSLLMVFDSVDGAVRCAVKVQQQVSIHDGDQPPDRAIRFRIGINVGDVIPDGTDVHGDVVNVAARLQAECPPDGICVSRSVRDHVADRLNLVFEELGSLKLKNIARPIDAFVVRSGAPAPVLKLVERVLVRASPDILPLPDKPSIAVLPFANLSGDPAQEYFADGMVEEIITALSRIRWLFVIARNSSLSYKGQSVDVRQVGRELGVRYVLEGSVRKARDRVRITGQLIDATSGVHLWADRFDGSLEDVFKLQDDVALGVAGVIEPALREAEIRHVCERAPTDPTAYDLYLRALPNHQTFERTQILRTLDLLRRALERDPHFGPALALSAWCRQQLAVGGWADNPDTNRDEAINLVRQALQVANDDPGVLASAAHVLCHLGEDMNAVVALIDRALELNPSSAQGWYWSAIIRYLGGRPDVSLKHLETFLRLSPRNRWPAYLTGIGIALFLSERFEEAAVMLLRAVHETPTFPSCYRFLASCYAHLGRLDDAREIIKQLQKITPHVATDFLQFRDSGHRELILSGLRQAMAELD